MDANFFDDALEKYAALQPDRAERYRKRRYEVEVRLIQDATAEVERLLGLYVPMNDWTVRLVHSTALPKRELYDLGRARAVIDAARCLSLWYFPEFLGFGTGRTSKVIGVREYGYQGRRYVFAKAIQCVEDVGELAALPADMLDAARHVADCYPRVRDRPIAWHELEERNSV